jgi:hypothetical protein
MKKEKKGLIHVLLICFLCLSLTLSIPSHAIDFTVTVSENKPDLSIYDMYISPPQPMIHDTVLITTDVQNVGRADAPDVTVTFYDNGNHIGTEIISVPYSDVGSVSISWTPTDVGVHTILVDVDEDDVIEELSEDDNQAQISTYVTKPPTISLTADPETIEADGVSTSTISAIITNERGRGVKGIEITFSTTLGTLHPSTAQTTGDGIATTRLTSSTSAGSATVRGRATINDISLEDTVRVIFDKTAIARTGRGIRLSAICIFPPHAPKANVAAVTGITVEEGTITISTTHDDALLIADNAHEGSVIHIPIEGGLLEVTLDEDATCEDTSVTSEVACIKLNTPPEEYITSQPDVGTAITDLDVEFAGTFTPEDLSFTMTQRDDIDDMAELISASGDEIKDNIRDAFGNEDVTHSDIEEMTALAVCAELSGKYIDDNVTEVSISTTINEEWFEERADGSAERVKMLVMSDSGEVVAIDQNFPVLTDPINNTATLNTTFGIPTLNITLVVTPVGAVLVIAVIVLIVRTCRPISLDHPPITTPVYLFEKIYGIRLFPQLTRYIPIKHTERRSGLQSTAPLLQMTEAFDKDR